MTAAHPEAAAEGGIAFGDNARRALGDAGLRTALDGLTQLSRARRAQVLATTGDWESLRDRARAIKDEMLERLPEYLAEFATRAEAAGAVVHHAADAGEACAIVVRLALERGVQMVVKSKSMVSEEIGLNDALAAAGVRPVETDLGEWILQLAGEAPSHIVVPAIHKTRRDIAALFADRLGTVPDADAETLTATARGALRAEFAVATMGVSGVNFGVAETGSIVIVENEGNARLATSLPHVHVALMGIERLIPTLDDLDVFLRLLPRAGTGQRLTTYQSVITGVVPEGGEGPRELHVVLVDNGRWAVHADPVLRGALACIRCGACLNVCPVYQQVGGHAYGSVYPGPIGAVVTPALGGVERAAELPFASTLCGACREVCPVKIDIPAMLLYLRAKAVAARRARPAAARASLEGVAMRAWRVCMQSPWLYRAATGTARVLQRVARAVLGPRWPARIRRIVPPLGRWAAGREVPDAAPRSFRTMWERGL